MMMKPLMLLLPYPDHILSPNSPKRHWRHKQSAKEMAYTVGYYTALRDCERLYFSPTDLLQLGVTFNPPDKRHRDLDNVFSSIKSVLDGVCAGLKIDDAQIQRVVLEWGKPVRHGEVVLLLERIS
jgi:crossover junction endodeoxyribonuclease RusA